MWYRSLLLLALLSPVLPAGAQDRPIVGIGTHSLDDLNRQLIQAVGGTAIRTTLYWHEWEANPTYRNSIATQIAEAGREGFDLLVVVHGQPARFTFENHDEAFKAYADLLGGLAGRFSEVEAWQLWNEMDVATFTDLFGVRNGVNPEAQGRLYGEMLDRAYDAIRAANPAALVVTGGLAGPVESGFLEGLLQTNARMDAVAIHTYGFPVLVAAEQRGRAAQALLDQHGQSEKPLWVTEFGMEAAVIAPGFDRSREAIDRYHLEAWRDPILWNVTAGIFDRMYGHVLRQDGDHSFDLIRRDGTLRPAAVWLRDYFR